LGLLAVFYGKIVLFAQIICILQYYFIENNC